MTAGAHTARVGSEAADPVRSKVSARRQAAQPGFKRELMPKQSTLRRTLLEDPEYWEHASFSTASVSRPSASSTDKPFECHFRTHAPQQVEPYSISSSARPSGGRQAQF
jgi:hypothetical protein